MTNAEIKKMLLEFIFFSKQQKTQIKLKAKLLKIHFQKNILKNQSNFAI